MNMDYLASIDGKYFSLHGFVKLVEGTSRDALYNFKNNTLLSLPKEAAAFIKMSSQIKVSSIKTSWSREDRAFMEAGINFLVNLSRKDYGHFSDSVTAAIDPLKLREEHDDGLYKICIDLPLSDSFFSAFLLSKYVAPARKKFGTQHLNVRFINGGTDGADRVLTDMIEILKSLAFHSTEIMVTDDLNHNALSDLLAIPRVHFVLDQTKYVSDQVSASVKSLAKRDNVKVLLEDGERRLESMADLITNPYLFNKKKREHILAGQLYINSQEEVFLHRRGALPLAQGADHQEIGSIITSPGILNSWRTNIDKHRLCGDCEFRYACPLIHYSPYLASSNTDIERCKYDPGSGEWDINDELPDLVEIYRCESKYFDINIYGNKRSVNRRSMSNYIDNVVDRFIEEIAPDMILKEKVGYHYFGPLMSDDSLNPDWYALISNSLAGKIKNGLLRGPQIISSYACHTHEILHALLAGINNAPKFFVSESCATIWGCLRSIEHQSSEYPTSKTKSASLRGRVATNGETEHLARGIIQCDAISGDIVYPVKIERSEVHLITNLYCSLAKPTPTLEELWGITDIADVKYFLYEFGGSFFRWLIDTYGPSKFRDFYSGDQSIASLGIIYDATLEVLESQWARFVQNNETL